MQDENATFLCTTVTSPSKKKRTDAAVFQPSTGLSILRLNRRHKSLVNRRLEAAHVFHGAVRLLQVFIEHSKDLVVEVSKVASAFH